MPAPEHNFRVPTPEEVADLAKSDPNTLAEITAAFMRGYEPGFLPKPVFTEMARIGVLSTVELVPLMHNEEEDQTKVLLTRRPQKDDWWVDQLHVPGVVLLGTDGIHPEKNYDYTEPFDRLVRTELGGAVSMVTEPQILLPRFAGDPKVRGRESSLIHWAEVAPVEGTALPDNAAFYPVPEVFDDQRANFIPFHDKQVAFAVEAFAAYRAQQQ